MLVVLILNLTPQITFANEDNKWIVRNILLDYKIEEASKTLNVYYIQIQQQKGKEPIIDNNFVKTIYLDESEDISNKNLKEFVAKNQSLFYDIYINDEILGIKAPIFADLSKNKLSEDEIQNYINKALERIKKDFENPPSKEEIDKQVSEKMEKFNPQVEQQDYSIIKFIFMLIGFLLVFSIFIALRNMKNRKK
jgi:hypothetical protein